LNSRIPFSSTELCVKSLGLPERVWGVAVNNAHFHALHRPYQVLSISKELSGGAKARCHQWFASNSVGNYHTLFALRSVLQSGRGKVASFHRLSRLDQCFGTGDSG
jgi:hypothetical protein